MGRPPSIKNRGIHSRSNSPADGLLHNNAATGAAAAAGSVAASASGRTSANRNVDVLQDNNVSANEDAAHDSNNSGGDNNSNSNKANSNNNTNESSSSWKPPLWLQSDGGGGGGAMNSGSGSSAPGAGGRNSNNNNSRKIKTFRIPIAPVPNDLRQVISKRIIREQWNPPEQARMRQLSTKLRDQKVRLEKVQDKIAILQQKKDMVLNEIRSRYAIQCQQAMDEIRQKMLNEHDEIMKQRAKQWKRKVEEEFQARWKRRTEERLAERERSNRLREESKLAAEAAAAEAAAAAGEAASESLLEPPQKKARLEDNDNETTRDQADDKKDAASTGDAPTNTAAAAAEAGELPVLESTVKQKQIEELQKEAESLNQNRTELIWLLKEVIKSEEKQKAKSSSKPESRITTSKQA